MRFEKSRGVIPAVGRPKLCARSGLFEQSLFQFDEPPFEFRNCLECRGLASRLVLAYTRASRHSGLLTAPAGFPTTCW